MKKCIKVLALALALSLAALAAFAEANKDRMLNLSILAPLTTTNPMNSSNLQDNMVLLQMADGLWAVNEGNMKVEPRIAESWDISADGKVYTFHLNPKAKFHNGDTVKASDCVFSFEYASKNPRMSSFYTSIAKVEAPDDRTFVMTLTAPNAGIFATLNTHCFMLSEREFKEQGEKFGTQIHKACCGPYMMSRLDGLDSYWELTADPNYYRGEAPIKKISYKPIIEASAGLIAFESGELDWYIAPIANWDGLTANPDYHTELVPANHQSYFIINYTNGELKDINLRKAIAYAINKDECNDVCYSGLAKIAKYMYNPETNIAAPAHDVYYEYNPELAKEYLKKSSMPDGGKLSGAIQCSSGGYFQKMAVVIQQNLADIGLEVNVTPMQSATNMDVMRQNRHFMGTSGGTCRGDYDAIREWYHSNSAGTSFIKFNAGTEFDSKCIDSMLDKGAALNDPAERSKVYAEVDSYVAKGAVYIPIFHKVQPYVWTKALNIPKNYSNFPSIYEWSWN